LSPIALVIQQGKNDRIKKYSDHPVIRRGKNSQKEFDIS
jgi:hypothetical protein